MFFSAEKTRVYKAAEYTRLSRDDGDKPESESIANQKALIQDYVDRHPDIEIIEVYTDDGFTGTNFERPSFQKMMEDIKVRKIDCVIVKDLSRFGRNYIESGRYLERIFPFMDVRFIAINDNIDSMDEQTRNDSITVPFKNLMNDAYCRDISTKIRSQLEVKRKKGDYISNFAVFGYTKDPKNRNHLIIDDLAANVVELIFRLKLSGFNDTRIADRLNAEGILSPLEYKRSQGLNFDCHFKVNAKALWTPVAVMRILKNEIYTGVMLQGKTFSPNYKVRKRQPVPPEKWIRVDSTHEPIIDKQDFEAVRNLMERDMRTAPGEDTLHLFSGYLFCADCGQNMVRRVVRRGEKSYPYYRCSTHKTSGGCTFHNISEAKIKESVFAAVTQEIEFIISLERILRYIESIPADQRNVTRLEAQVTELKSEIARYIRLKMKLYEDLTDGVLTSDEYMEFKAKYTSKIIECQKAQKTVEQEKVNVINSNLSDNFWIGAFKRYQRITELSRQLVVELLERVMIHEGGNIEVVFKFEDQVGKAINYINQIEDAAKMLRSVS